MYIGQLTSAIYLEKREDVEHDMEVMNDLGAEALTPAATARFLAEITGKPSVRTRVARCGDSPGR